jgi:hypothetical protein
MDNRKYIGYVELDIADTMPGSGLSRLLSPQRVLSLNKAASV